MRDPTNPAFDDARLIFDCFVKSDWRDLEIASGPVRLTISRRPPASRDGSGSRTEQPETSGDTLQTAPHVATLGELASVGSVIAAGDIYATLRVLDESIPLHAAKAMRVVAWLSRPGDLVEFASPLMRTA